jgi:hypothetical protein
MSNQVIGSSAGLINAYRKVSGKYAVVWIVTTLDYVWIPSRSAVSLDLKPKREYQALTEYHSTHLYDPRTGQTYFRFHQALLPIPVSASLKLERRFYIFRYQMAAVQKRGPWSYEARLVALVPILCD